MVYRTTVNIEQRINLLIETIQDETSPFMLFLGRPSSQEIKQWIELELGSVHALDRFIPHGSIQSKAIAPDTILHIVSGNTAHGALQSMFRGLLLGSHNLVKLPSSGLPEAEAFFQALPPQLQSMLELSTTIPDQWWDKAETVIAIGGNQAITSIHQRLRPHQKFIPHGHKVSCALVESPDTLSAQLAAIDITAFNQHGCLSPHAIYVTRDAEAFAKLLAIELEKTELISPRGSISLSESGAIANLRETYRYRSANRSDTQLWESPSSTAWTVIYENDPTLKLSCLNRTIYIKPWPSDPTELGPELAHLSTLAIHPFTPAMLAEAETLSPPRICPLGKCQQPSTFWHQDGFATLASLVSWRDIEL